jgi:hypothetical protein
MDTLDAEVPNNYTKKVAYAIVTATAAITTIIIIVIIIETEMVPSFKEELEYKGVVIPFN